MSVNLFFVLILGFVEAYKCSSFKNCKYLIDKKVVEEIISEHTHRFCTHVRYLRGSVQRLLVHFPFECIEYSLGGRAKH